jgi:perosamine synthetase
MASTQPHATVTSRPPRASYLPFAMPDLGDEEVEAVVQVLRGGWITTGPEVQAFQEEFARSLGVKHAVALNSCTAALHLALEGAGITAGDEVLTSTITFTATAEVVEYLGARTRFVDVGRADLNLDAGRVREVIAREYRPRADGWYHRESGGRLRALVPVHYAGHSCDMVALRAIAEEHGLFLLDDAAHALPATLDGVQVGAMGNPSAFSFYATKTLTTAEGGMLTTDDDALAARVRLMALHGISRDAWKRYAADGSWSYEVVEAGYKYNLTDIAAALGRVQLRRLHEMREGRAAIAARYTAAFSAMPEVEPPVVSPRVSHAWHLYPIRLRLETLAIDRARFIQELRDRQIGTSVHFIPLHTQPFYAERYGYRPADFPVAEAEFLRLISLPIYSKMSAEDVESVIDAVADVFEGHRREVAVSRWWAHGGKRAFDLFAAALLAPFVLLAGLLCAGLVLTVDGPPVLFRQTRVGRGGRPFEILKFRTMRPGPGPLVTGSGDPRVTRLGARLRRAKLDELPQLWNVLRGDMSLVGPRPEVPVYVAARARDYRAIAALRPGITDWASLVFEDEESVIRSHAGDPEFYERVLLPRKLALARLYQRRLSWRTDLAILTGTVNLVLLRRRGASGLDPELATRAREGL